MNTKLIKNAVLSFGVIFCYIAITLNFSKLRYYFPSINFEVIKLIIAGIIVVALLIIKQLTIEQLKPTGVGRIEWLKYPLIFAVLFFISSFTTYLCFFGSECLKIPSIKYIADTTLVLVGTVIFEEVIARAFLTNLLINIWKKDTAITKGIIIFSGTLFGILHFFNYREFSYVSILQSVFASFIGIYLCLAFWKTNRLFETIILHTIFNFPAFINALIFDTMSFPEKNIQLVSNITFTATLILSIPLLVISIRKLELNQKRSC